MNNDTHDVQEKKKKEEEEIREDIDKHEIQEKINVC